VDGGFEEWARARSPSLLRAAFLLTGHRQGSEDLVQTVLVKVALSWRRVDHPDAYARQVMYRLELRRWHRRGVAERLTGVLPEVPDQDAISQVDLRIVMAAAMAQLTRGQRAVLVLRFWEDLTEADTARVLGCSVGSVKSQTHKALRALRASAPDLAHLVEGLPADVTA
jgi:RNA polymerase sigma-70 factor (sigma-E family)